MVRLEEPLFEAVTGSNSGTMLTVTGDGLVAWAKVTLRDTPTGEVFPNPVREQPVIHPVRRH